MREYGTDEYGRYVVIDGEKMAVERYPFARPVYSRVVARWHICMWWIFCGLRGGSS